MPSFLSRSTSITEVNHHASLREGIRTALSDTIRDLQTEYGNRLHLNIATNQVSTAFLSSVEAIFIHGLKDSFLGKVTSALGSSSSSSSNPEPNFWLYLLIFSHRQGIDTITSLKHITTDVGRCRAWLRVALNEGLLSSYLAAMAQDRSSLRHHYGSYAFIRDVESFDIAIRLLRGIEPFTFDLAINSSMLNRWQNGPLVIAGVIPPPIDNSVTVAVDAVSALEQEDDSLIGTLTSHALVMPVDTSIKPLGQGLLSRGLMNEEEALRLILQSSSPVAGSPPIVKRIPDPFPPLPEVSLKICKTKERKGEETKEHEQQERNQEDNEDEEDELNSSKDSFDPSLYYRGEEEEAETMKTMTPATTMTRKFTLEDFRDSILASTPPSSCATDDDVLTLRSSEVDVEERMLPKLSGFIDAWDPFGNENRYFDTPPENEHPVHYGFSLKPDITVGGLTAEESQFMMSCLDVVTHESGLDAQNWECFDCSKALGTIFGPYKTCVYTKKYYCGDCHVDDLRSIPYKVVLNWDHNKYPVSIKAKIFLDSIKIEPIINVQSFNSELFAFAADLDEIFTLRKKLSYLYLYLRACTKKANLASSMEKMIYPRDYLMTDVDLYSLEDLDQTYSGTLKTLLKYASKYATDHVAKCVICKGHGFICEVCRIEKPLYPFELEKISQCEKCYTVFHKQCSETITNCPKCERIESRNLNWHVNNVRIKKESSIDTC